jgi:hypothetical protein
MPSLTRRLLWITGSGLDVLAIMGLLADGDPERTGSRILGAVVVAAVGSMAVLAALSALRRPVVARLVGLAAAGGMLFVAWLVLSRPVSNVFTILVGLTLLVIGGIVGWQLFRWRPEGRSSGEAEDGAHVP